VTAPRRATVGARLLQALAAGAVAAILFAAPGLAGTTPTVSDARQACPPRPPTTVHRITRPRWISGAVITEYYPTREQWFSGKTVRASGLPGRHRADWLYGPHGVAMNGEGVGRDGRLYHFAGPYDTGWVDDAGRGTIPCWNGSWTNGEPAWLDFGWRNRDGQVTYPLAAGGWSNGSAARYLPPPSGLRFAPGPARPLPFWHTVAVDPNVVPLGSWVFIPAYCDTAAHGWFRALDTGGAIIAFHFDVYRPPPQTLQLRAFRHQRVYVVPPGTSAPPSSNARCR
jgi:3D (Asp-Asp-Asp) domain-containing protein